MDDAEARAKCVRRLCLSAVAALVLLLGQSASAQSERPVHWTAVEARRNGAERDVVVRTRIGEFFHLYSTTQQPGGPVRTSLIALPESKWIVTGTLRAPPPDSIPDANFGIMSEVYSDSLRLSLTLRPASAAMAESASLAIRYQACTTNYCLPPRTDTIVIRVRGDASPAVALPPVAPRLAAPSVGPTAPLQQRGANGLAGFLILAATMGALSLLTPCVFPMIPITVSSFAGHRGGVTRAAAYAAGIVTSFSCLGLGAALLFGATGLTRFAANPMVNLVIAALFVIFALSLMGALSLTVPSALLTRLSSHHLRKGALPAALTGVVFTLAAFTCTSPFIGSLLVISANGRALWPLLGMIAFSAAFALPFFLLALVPSGLNKLPRSGAWMVDLELALGAIELCAALKFLSNADLVTGSGLLSRRTVLLLWAGILVVLAVVLAIRIWKDRGRTVIVPAMTSCAALLTAVLLITGMRGRSLGELEAFLPPQAAGNSNLTWVMNDYDAALAIARRERRPVLIDFTGYTCTNCRWMEANMFPRREITLPLARFVRVRLYTDGLGEPYRSHQALEEKLFGTVALPLYAIVNGDGQPVESFLGMTRDAREFSAFLTRGAQ